MPNLASPRRRMLVLATAGFAAAGVAAPAAASSHPARADVSTAKGSSPFIAGLHKIDTLSSAVPTSGPAKGDENPYGVAVVSRSKGSLVRGSVLVSNFNNSKNEQGTGSSIVEITPAGALRTFAVVPRPTSTPAVGLTTALVYLKRGFVIVGSLPAPGGKSANARAGALTVLNSTGHVVSTIRARDINGPWDMTAVDRGRSAVLFVTNVLNGTVAAKGKVVRRGTVVRLKLSLGGGKPRVVSNRVIATGFPEHTDPAALIVGPTGVGLGRGGTLYVADSAANRVAAVPKAMTRTSALSAGGRTVSAHGSLNDPLGLMTAPDGDIVTANGGDGRFVETSPAGTQVAVKNLIPNGGGDLFGLALAPNRRGIYFVDDAGSGNTANSLRLLR
jgi:sugar lactone lactonase YvrE